MVNRNKDLAECGLHFVLAATYLAHEPTPQTIVAILAYLGLAALSLAEREEEKKNEHEQPDTNSRSRPAEHGRPDVERSASAAAGTGLAAEHGSGSNV